MYSMTYAHTHCRDLIYCYYDMNLGLLDSFDLFDHIIQFYWRLGKRDIALVAEK